MEENICSVNAYIRQGGQGEKKPDRTNCFEGCHWLAFGRFRPTSQFLRSLSACTTLHATWKECCCCCLASASSFSSSSNGDGAWSHFPANMYSVAACRAAHAVQPAQVFGRRRRADNRCRCHLTGACCLPACAWSGGEWNGMDWN